MKHIEGKFLNQIPTTTTLKEDSAYIVEKNNEWILDRVLPFNQYDSFTITNDTIVVVSGSTTTTYNITRDSQDRITAVSLPTNNE